MPRPQVGEGQVLVQVVAAGINPGEIAIRNGRLDAMFSATFQDRVIARQAKVGGQIVSVAGVPHVQAGQPEQGQ